jgi:hypothetical protein
MSVTIGELYDRMSEADRKRWFFFLFQVVEFYAKGDTWFATTLIHDPPSGLINGDFHYCEDLNRRAPGGRARIAFAWLLKAWERLAAPQAGEDT